MYAFESTFMTYFDDNKGVLRLNNSPLNLINKAKE